MELFQALLFTREDDSPASHHEAALPALEEAGDDEGLVGAAGHDTDVQTHARLASDNWPLAARAPALSLASTLSLYTLYCSRECVHCHRHVTIRTLPLYTLQHISGCRQ